MIIKNNQQAVSVVESKFFIDNVSAMPNYRQVILVILDGWGISPKQEYNAIALAPTPCFDELWNEYPHTTLDASEDAVGLPTGQMGNSEIGHMTIGAGRILAADLVRISRAINDGVWDKDPALASLFEHVLKNNSVLHAVGLVSPGGVHSHQEHLHAFLSLAKKKGVKKVVIHAITDGRDTPPQSAHDYLASLEKEIEHVGLGNISTITGRFFAMDRDNNWDRVAKAEAAMFEGKGKVYSGKKPSEVVRECHENGLNDEHFEPMVFVDKDGDPNTISENDGIFFFNFRADRARMLTERLLQHVKVRNLFLLTMTQYDANFSCQVAFPPESVETTLANEISKKGISQAHIAETEKYAHVTYFLNGGREEPHNNEKHVLVESRKDISTHDLAPEMRAKEVAEKVVEHLSLGTDLIVVNFANADMVGHTGKQEAILKAITAVDEALKKVYDTAIEKKATMLVTADHGNAEKMVDEETNVPHTAHTTNQVPLIITDKTIKKLRTEGTLADITPTILEMFKIEKPASMTGKSLVV